MLPRVQLVSDVALFERDVVTKVLLVRYRRPGYDTGWYLPDVLLNDLEHPEEAAKRVLRDQLGVDSRKVSLSHIESFRAEGLWHLVFHYMADHESGVMVYPSADIAELRWFPANALPGSADVGFSGWALKTIQRIFNELNLESH